MGSDLQCSWIAFLAVVHVFDVLIFSGALFHTLAASQIKLFFSLVDLPTSVRSPRVTLKHFRLPLSVCLDSIVKRANIY
jgi:hypothetical protein